MYAPSSTNTIEEKVVIDYTPYFRLFESGRMERLTEVPPVQPSLDPKTKVESKDATTKEGVLVRLFKPNLPKNKKVPLLLYFHGGAFIFESTLSPKYHNYLNNLASEAQVMIVSVEYRQVPEHRLPAAYHDCCNALNWVVFHAKEVWIKDHVDFTKVYLMGDSAGGNIAHYLAMRLGVKGLPCDLISGIILVHPMFWGKQRIGNEAARCSLMSAPDLADQVWAFACPTSSDGVDDPWFNPARDPNLRRLGCKRVLVLVAGNDFLRDRGLYYKEVLVKSGWQGRVDVVECKGENHAFHLRKPSSVNSVYLMRKVVAFINFSTFCTLNNNVFDGESQIVMSNDNMTLILLVK